MTVAPDYRQDSEVQTRQDAAPDGFAEGRGGGVDEEEQERTKRRRQEQKQEALRLRERGVELEERLVAARTGLASARERREFMQEEAEQARDYGTKLAQEMARLARIDRTLPPEQSASLEKLRRLVATLTETELQEQAALEEGRAREAALRTEIEEFTGGSSGGRGDDGGQETATTVPEVKPPTAEEEGRDTAEVAARRTRGRGRGTAVLQKTVDDPLAAAPTGGEREGDNPAKGRGERVRLGAMVAGMPRAASAAATGRGGEGDNARKKKVTLEGKALLAEGLHRIEAAYEKAAAEREATASRLSRLRLAVARRQREEDAAPRHAELLQYLLKFEELGRHALERQEQLRKCQAERSTLSLTREFLASEARLLETIASGVEEASKGGKGAREAYMRQLKKIVEGVEDSLENQTRLLEVARGRRRAAEETQQSVGEERRRFLAGSKELADECYRYEALNAHLALMRR